MGEGVFPFNVLRLFPLHQHVRLADGVSFFVQLLAVKVNFQTGVNAGQQVLLGDGEHAAGAAGGVVDPHQTFLGQLCPVRFKHQLDHQPDDVAGGIKLTGGVVAGFLELSDEVLEDGSHAVVVHVLRREVDIGE